ncbi:hypothetical protein C4J81_04740 [Deltaproteobacteria bacterium Smac51]|nr:hypothetical protein C4J81_04740 [Deltaproteobacteria bacterium Smac51]
MSPKIRAILYLVLTAVIWGLSFPIGRHALDTISPMALSTFRYMFGALAVMPLAMRWRHRQALGSYLEVDAPLLWLKAGFMSGVLMTAGTALQLYGLAHSTAGKAGFLTCLYLSLVPVLAFVSGYVPRLMVWVGLVMGLAGLYLLTGAGTGGESFGLSGSDGLILVADIFWALQVLVTGQYALRVNTWLFMFAQTFVCFVLSMIIMIFTGGTPSWSDFLATLVGTGWGILSVGVGFALQTVAQRHVSATTASLILPFQAVVGAVAGVIFLNETMTTSMIMGAVVLILGSFVAQFAKDPVLISKEDKNWKTIMALRIFTAGVIGGGGIFLLIRAVF